MVRFFIYFYITINLLVAVLGVRNWPFTDYPMFGESFEKFDYLGVYKLKTLESEEDKWISIGDVSYCPESHHFKSMIEDKEKLKNYIRHLQKYGWINHSLQKYKIIEHFVIRDNLGAFHEDKRDILYFDLSKD